MIQILAQVIFILSFQFVQQIGVLVKSNGFVYSHIIKDFFTNNYDHIIEEDGIVLKDMIYFRKEIGNIIKYAN